MTKKQIAKLERTLTPLIHEVASGQHGLASIWVNNHDSDEVMVLHGQNAAPIDFEDYVCVYAYGLDDLTDIDTFLQREDLDNYAGLWHNVWSDLAPEEQFEVASKLIETFQEWGWTEEEATENMTKLADPETRKAAYNDMMDEVEDGEEYSFRIECLFVFFDEDKVRVAESLYAGDDWDSELAYEVDQAVQDYVSIHDELYPPRPRRQVPAQPVAKASQAQKARVQAEPAQVKAAQR